MMDPLVITVMCALIATIVVLVMGLVSMGRGGDYDRQHSEQLMFARVGFQGFAVLCMIVSLYLAST